MQQSLPLTVAFSTSPAMVRSKPKVRISSLQVASSIAAATGEADQAFQLGIQLEKAGLARAASAAFHEAATLYQCYLDHHATSTVAASSTDQDKEASPFNIFQHVTSLSPSDRDSSPSVLAVLAYACIRLAHLSHDAFGDSRAATRLYKLAASIDPLPSAVAYHGIGTSIEGSCQRLNDEASWREEMEKAVDAYRAASTLGGGLWSNGEVLFHLAVALERLGEVDESEKIMEELRRGESNLSCLVDSWGYVRWHTRRAFTCIPSSCLTVMNQTKKH